MVPKIIELPNNRVDLVFEITEGKKTGVKQIRFVGNQAYYGDYRLKDVIKTTEIQLPELPEDHATFTIRTGSRLTAICCAGSISSMASPTCASCPRSANSIRHRKRFIVTFTIEEGDQYTFGQVDVQSNVRSVDAATVAEQAEGKAPARSITPKRLRNPSKPCRSRSRGAATRLPWSAPAATATSRPARSTSYSRSTKGHAPISSASRSAATRARATMSSGVNSISAEGDAYNRALIDRAERRLKNLNYFKSVKITNEPGTSPDRVVVNVDVEEQSTGEFSISGGYSTQDGWLGEVSVGERNLLGRGQAARASVQYGERARGFELSFVEPYFLGLPDGTWPRLLRQGDQRTGIYILRHADRSAVLSVSASSCVKT